MVPFVCTRYAARKCSSEHLGVLGCLSLASVCQCLLRFGQASPEIDQTSNEIHNDILCAGKCDLLDAFVFGCELSRLVEVLDGVFELLHGQERFT